MRLMIDFRLILLDERAFTWMKSVACVLVTTLHKKLCVEC